MSNIDENSTPPKSEKDLNEDESKYLNNEPENESSRFYRFTQFGLIKSNNREFINDHSPIRNNTMMDEESECKIFTEFVNIYTESNMVLPDGEMVYFLMCNMVEYFCPIIFKGEILDGLYGDGMSINYYIRTHELIDTQLRKHIDGMPFEFYAMNGPKISVFPKSFQIRSYGYIFKEHLIAKVNCFFVRKELEDIKKLQKEYTHFIVNDMRRELELAEDVLKLI